MYYIVFFFFKQKTAYEMRISDWSSDVCSSDLFPAAYARLADLKLPAQVLWGDADFPHIQQRCVHLVQAIPRALGTVVSGTAHLPHLEQPEAFNRHLRSEERRVGQESVSTFRSRWSPYH